MDILTAMETLGGFFGEDDGICAGKREKEAWDRVRIYVTQTLMMRMAQTTSEQYDER